jgi:hypothetical protein
MARSASVVRVAGIAVVIAAFFGCGGEVIHLGDGKGQNGGGESDGAIDRPTGVGGSGGVDLVDDCPHGQVKAGEVLWIGDSWITIPGNQHTRVRDLARAAVAIGPNDDYVIAAVPGASMAAVANQYRNNTQIAGAPEFKVLIMDGGTLDPFLFGNTDATIENVVSTFEQLLATVADDGLVEHVIYYHCPEHPILPGIATLRPLMQQTCEQSPVNCYFLDLQPLWAGHPEYSTGVQPSVAGGQVIAEQIWGIMQENCIAQ